MCDTKLGTPAHRFVLLKGSRKRASEPTARLRVNIVYLILSLEFTRQKDESEFEIRPDQNSVIGY